MRIIKFLLFSLGIVAVLAVISFFIAREVLLLGSRAKIEEALAELKLINRNPQLYSRECKLKGSPSGGAIIQRLQLRFTSPNEYVTEILCDQFPDQPILLKRGQLLPFVTKLPGYSGVIWGDSSSGFELQVWGRILAIGVDKQEVRAGSIYAPGQLQPATTCRGFSQVCCQNEAQQGIGSVNAQATDCAQNCFSSCQSRPVILSFTTDPFYEPNARLLTIRRNASVGFAYVASSTEKLPPNMTIVYGDGQQEVATGFTGQFQHVYSCAVERCSYTAYILAQDEFGIQSAITPLTQVTVVVQ